MIVKTSRRGSGFYSMAAARLAACVETLFQQHMQAMMVELDQQHMQAMMVELEAKQKVVLKQVARELAEGDQLRIYVAKIDEEMRHAQWQRIGDAIRAGEPTTVIARRESVTERHVRRVRGRIGGPTIP